MTKEKRQILIFLFFAAAVLATPFLLKGSYFLNVLVFIGIHTMLAVGLESAVGICRPDFSGACRLFRDRGLYFRYSDHQISY